jgi:hypothetical protein
MVCIQVLCLQWGKHLPKAIEASFSQLQTMRKIVPYESKRFPEDLNFNRKGFDLAKMRSLRLNRQVHSNKESERKS